MTVIGTSLRIAGSDAYEQWARHSQVKAYARDLNRTQWLNADELHDLQWQRLRLLLQSAEKHVPYYRRVFAELGLRPEALRTWQDFTVLPLLTKPLMQQHADELKTIDPNCDSIPHHTGGSTGQPVHFCLSPSSRDFRVAAANRADGWTGWQRGQKVMHLWSLNVFNRAVYASRKARLRDWLESRRMVNFADFSPAELVELINQYRPSLLVAYTTPLYQLACHLLKAGGLRWHPQAAIVSAETLHEFQRVAIERAFSCPVFNRYGCSEVGCIAAECDQHDGLHVMTDSLIVELLPVANDPTQDLQQVVVTDLNNFATPFIRYQTGDLARWKRGDLCACGRHLPRFELVAGRVMDCLHTPDGRLIPGQLALRLFENLSGIRQFQLVQEGPGRVQIKLVTDSAQNRELETQLEQGLKQLLGSSLAVTIQRVDQIPLAASGKHRYIVNAAAATTPHQGEATTLAGASSTDPLLSTLMKVTEAQRQFAVECRQSGYEAFAREADTIAEAYSNRLRALTAMKRTLGA